MQTGLAGSCSRRTQPSKPERRPASPRAPLTGVWIAAKEVRHSQSLALTRTVSFPNGLARFIDHHGDPAASLGMCLLANTMVLRQNTFLALNQDRSCHFSGFWKVSSMQRCRTSSDFGLVPTQLQRQLRHHPPRRRLRSKNGRKRASPATAFISRWDLCNVSDRKRNFQEPISLLL